jgi:hypothetical protein
MPVPTWCQARSTAGSAVVRKTILENEMTTEITTPTTAEPMLTPPVARREPKQNSLHGTVLVDEYGWLREKEAAEVTAYLEAENAYAEAVMEPLSDLREKLYQEMLSHIKQTDVSVPYRDGAWWYYSRTEEGLQYPVSCRRADVNGAPEPGTEHVILDGNALAEGALAGLYRRPHGLSPVHAAHQGPEYRRSAGWRGRAGWVGGVGGGRTRRGANALLHG